MCVSAETLYSYLHINIRINNKVILTKNRIYLYELIHSLTTPISISKQQQQQQQQQQQRQTPTTISITAIRIYNLVNSK